MNAPRDQEWIRAAILAGAGYFVVGRLFSLPADHVEAWRVAAWLVSGVIYAAHIRYEHFTLRNSPRFAALHVAVGVAIGAFALAVAGMIHSVSTLGVLRPTWLLALVLWPLLTGVPAFLGAFVIGSVLPSRPQR